MKPEEWERLLLQATDRVREKVARSARKADRGASVGVGASGDTTLRADKMAEDELVGTILKVRGTRILSEEAGFLGERGAETLAVVDPVDGSSNFERGIPFYCTAVAVVEGDRLDDITVGVVRDLVNGDVYHAVKGKGTKKNGKPVRTSQVTDLSKAVLGVDVSRGSQKLVSGLAPLLSRARRHVHLGANALELSYVSDRTIDAFVDVRNSIRITDLAAAYLVAAEAGAEITGVDGRRLDGVFDLEHRLSFVASANPALHKQILDLCSPAANGGR